MRCKMPRALRVDVGGFINSCAYLSATVVHLIELIPLEQIVLVVTGAHERRVGGERGGDLAK